MGKRKHPRRLAHAPEAPSTQEPSPDDQVIAAGNLSMHDLFQRQAMTILDRPDLSEEQKQEVLVAMACPCCGAGAVSYIVKLKR